MSDGIRFDMGEVDAFAAELLTIDALVQPALVATTHRAANNIKRSMKTDASGHDFLRGLPAQVDYDFESSPGHTKADIGFIKRGQGNLANFAVYGSVNNAPVMDITRGLRAEEPVFAKYVAEAFAQVFK